MTAVGQVETPPDRQKRVPTRPGRGRGTVDLRPDDDLDRDVQIEVARMAREIARAKREIAAIKHPMAGNDRVTTASKHLEEIVSMTESATSDIIEAVETVDDILRRVRADGRANEQVRDLADAGSARLVRILEACAFQDVTGQRITHVVSVLRLVEQRVLTMIGIWGITSFQDLPVVDQDEGSALTGPALSGQGLSQEDVDALFD